MSFPEVFQLVLYGLVSLFVIGAALYVLTSVVLVAALALKELWYRARYGRKR